MLDIQIMAYHPELKEVVRCWLVDVIFEQNEKTGEDKYTQYFSMNPENDKREDWFISDNWQFLFRNGETGVEQYKISSDNW